MDSSPARPERRMPTATDAPGPSDGAAAALPLDEPAVTAYEDLSGESVRLRVMIKTMPGKQWDVQRALRGRIRHSFSAAGISLALPHREVEVRHVPSDQTAQDQTAQDQTGQDQKSKG